MAFKKKTWKDRMVEYAGRRKLTNITTKQEVIYDVARSEGTVSQEGDAFSSQSMNDLEQRIEDGFTEVKQTTDTLNQNLNGYQFGTVNGVPSYKAGADAAWVPFKRAGYVKTQQYTNNWCNDGVSMTVNLSDCPWYKQATKDNIKCGISYVAGHGGNGANIVIETYVTSYNSSTGAATIFIRGDILNPVILVCMIP